MDAVEVAVMGFGDLFDSTPEGLYRMDTLRRDADARLMVIVREEGLGLIEVDELRRALEERLDRAVLGIPSERPLTSAVA